MQYFWSLTLLLLFLTISGCVTDNGETISQTSCSIEPECESAPWCQVYFTYEDDVEGCTVDLIDSAQDNIYMAVYDLDLESVADALTRASDRGVNITMIMDNTQAEREASMCNCLQEKGIPLVLDRSKSDFMHNKVIVVDGKKVWTGSTNPTQNGVNKNNNNALVIESEELAENYIAEIEEMWCQYELGERKVTPTPHPDFEIGGVRVENYFAPEDDVEEEILSELDSAESSIRFMTFTFTSDPIEEKLIEKSEDGVDVKGIFESRQTSRYAAYGPLCDSGITVIKDKNGYTMHHKVFIIDNITTITGSFNPTKHANEDNDENILIIHDSAVSQEYLEEFDNLWIDWCG